MLLTKDILYRGHKVTYEQLSTHSVISLDVECDSCHKSFKSTKYQLERNGHQLCRSCAVRSKLEKTLPINSVWGRLTVIGKGRRGGFSVCRCECGHIGEYWNTALRSGQTRSCGCLQRDCARENIKHAHFCGEAHPNWKGGIAPERNCIESSKDYQDFRKKVMERDEHTCQKCGSKHDVCIHHIYNFESYPDKRTDVNNGIVLCRKCHRNFHHEYGLLNTNPQQLKDFLSA